MRTTRRGWVGLGVLFVLAGCGVGDTTPTAADLKQTLVERGAGL